MDIIDGRRKIMFPDTGLQLKRKKKMLIVHIELEILPGLIPSVFGDVVEARIVTLFNITLLQNVFLAMNLSEFKE